jgi:hypothetical protein
MPCRIGEIAPAPRILELTLDLPSRRPRHHGRAPAPPRPRVPASPRPRAPGPRAPTLAGLALALSILPGTFGAGPGAAALVGMLLLSTGPRPAVGTVSYPLATESSAESGLGDGLVIGPLNGTWAAGLVLAPLLAGALDQAAGPRAAYLVAIVRGALGALWLSSRPRLEPVAPGWTWYRSRRS